MGTIMKQILIIDDIRTFADTDVVKYTHARTSEEGFKYLNASEWHWDEIFLDHDIPYSLENGEVILDTIRGIVCFLEEYHEDFKNTKIKIISSNSVGRAYIKLALERYYEIIP